MSLGPHLLRVAAKLGATFFLKTLGAGASCVVYGVSVCGGSCVICARGIDVPALLIKSAHWPYPGLVPKGNRDPEAGPWVSEFTFQMEKRPVHRLLQAGL